MCCQFSCDSGKGFREAPFPKQNDTGDKNEKSGHRHKNDLDRIGVYIGDRPSHVDVNDDNDSSRHQCVPIGDFEQILENPSSGDELGGDVKNVEKEDDAGRNSQKIAGIIVSKPIGQRKEIVRSC